MPLLFSGEAHLGIRHGADAPAVIGSEINLVQAGAGAVVVSQAAHGVDAQGGFVAGLDVDVGHDATVVAAQRQVDLRRSDQG